MEGFGIEREDFLRKFLKLPNGIPDSDTFRRLFERLKPDEVSKCLTDWLEITRKKREVVKISKLSGGIRELGIPTVVDRIIEQAIAQKLVSIAEPYFSENSYGFRTKRRAQQAVIKVLEYLNDGYEYIVDIDLEKFFDNVPQDKLMTLVGKLIHDPDTESLIRKYLKAGVMVKGKLNEVIRGWIKLLQNGEHEAEPEENRRTSKNAHEDSHMKTMKNKRKAMLWNEETRCSRVDGKAAYAFT